MPMEKPGDKINNGAAGSDPVFDMANSPKQDNFWVGAFNSDMQYFDPLIVGYAFIIWTRLPKLMTEVYPQFANLTQKNFAGFDGLSDIELQTAGVTEGFSPNEYHVAQGLGAKPSQFTLKHLEYSGNPIKNMYQHWVTSIRDPRTGIATYPKRFEQDYRAKNHTGELMYIVTRPDANNYEAKQIIEFAAYWTAVMPKKIPLGHLNYTKGSQNAPIELDIPFSGVMHIGKEVDNAAQTLLANNDRRSYSFEEQDEYNNSGQGFNQLG
jgi:hypothetical protein